MKITKCLLDMDGVIVDFASGAYRLLGRPKPEPIPKVIDDHELWSLISENPLEFWSNLSPYTWTHKLLAYVDSQFRLTDQRIWTICSCPRGEECKTGKRAWLGKQPIRPSIPLLFTHDKSRYACADTVLIDGNQAVIDSFVKAGGEGILFPAPWNSYGDFAANPVEFIKESLDELY